MAFICKDTRDPETNSKFAPANGWLEDEIPFGKRPIFRCENISFRECMQLKVFLTSFSRVKESHKGWRDGLQS